MIFDTAQASCETSFVASCRWLHNFTPSMKLAMQRWGIYPPRSLNQIASTRRDQLSVTAKIVRSTDLLNQNIKILVNTDKARLVVM